jgi:sugar O-acyltransferase (sialic acid O-acetyltransferase NeuD family)
VRNRHYIFWGASGHAKVLRDLVALRGDVVDALFDNDPAIQSPWPGIRVHHGIAALKSWLAENGSAAVYGAVAVGGARGRDRRELAAQLAALGVNLPTLIHPGAVVAASASLGDATQVLAGAVVGSDVILGDSVIINTLASVDHECRLGDGVHLAPRATLCGCVTVGANSLIGPGAVIIPRVRIGSNSVIGAGAVVTRDLPDGVVAWGSPARIMRHAGTAEG